MPKSAQAVSSAPSLALQAANHFELRLGRTSITFTERNIAGEPVLTFDDGSPRSFSGDEIRLEKTELGTLVTVTLEMIPDLLMRLLTLVLPEVLVIPGTPERFSTPVVFHEIAMSIAGPPLQPGPVQTYGVKIFDGEARLVHS